MNQDSSFSLTDELKFWSILQSQLLSERSEKSHWTGKLSASPLSTATALSAFALYFQAANQDFSPLELRSRNTDTANSSKNPDLTKKTTVSTILTEQKLISVSELKPIFDRGIRWLLSVQNPDSGWGDTLKSFSNTSTTMLVQSALTLALKYYQTTESNQISTNQTSSDQTSFKEDSSADWSKEKTPVFNLCSNIQLALDRAEQHLNENGGIKGIRKRYGRDKTFVVPILTNAALAGLVSWKEVLQLPFEIAAFPHSFFRFLRLPVVSYALPALIAIGQVRHFFRPSPFFWMRQVRTRLIRRTLKKLRSMQPESGGFLEAAPLTAFVVMSLVPTGLAQESVVQSGLRFLAESFSEEGSCPIDTNLANWLTTLSVNALCPAPHSLESFCPDLYSSDFNISDLNSSDLFSSKPLCSNFLNQTSTSENQSEYIADPAENNSKHFEQNIHSEQLKDVPNRNRAKNKTIHKIKNENNKNDNKIENGNKIVQQLLKEGVCDWILACQHRKRHPFTAASPGGWAWTNLSGGVPDGDDTPSALLALSKFYPFCSEIEKKRVFDAACFGLQWLLELQNRDGGMPTFCRGWGKLPFDRSSSDLTAHALRAFSVWIPILSAAKTQKELFFPSSPSENIADSSKHSESANTFDFPNSSDSMKISPSQINFESQNFSDSTESSEIRHKNEKSSEYKRFSSRLILNRLYLGIPKALKFLLSQQKKDGFWLPLWFGNQHLPDDINPFYGTGKVLLALIDFWNFFKKVNHLDSFTNLEFISESEKISCSKNSSESNQKKCLQKGLKSENCSCSNTFYRLKRFLGLSKPFRSKKIFHLKISLRQQKKLQKSIRTAIQWILKNQNSDGGWGCFIPNLHSDQQLIFSPFIEQNISTSSHQNNSSATSNWEESAVILESLIAAADTFPDISQEFFLNNAISKAIKFLQKSLGDGTIQMESSPVGLYFAKLWYYENLYPLIFSVSAFRRRIDSLSKNLPENRSKCYQHPFD